MQVHLRNVNFNIQCKGTQEFSEGGFTPVRAFVWAEVLWPSQPNGVMWSAVNLPNHSFTGHAYFSKQLTSIVHILYQKRQLPFLNQQKGENDHRKYFKVKSPQKNVIHLAGVEPAPLITSRMCIQPSHRGLQPIRACHAYGLSEIKLKTRLVINVNRIISLMQTITTTKNIFWLLILSGALQKYSDIIYSSVKM